MASAAHEEAGPANFGAAQKRNLQKAFKHLRSHASAIANFTLQWQDLEDYIRSLQLQIDSRLAHLQTQTAAIAVAEPQEQEQNVAAPEAEADGVPDSSVKENAPSSPIRGDPAFAPSKDGKLLLLHLVEHMKGRKVTRYEVHDALTDFEICERVMLEAFKEYVHSRESRNDEVPLDLALARKICSVLLHEFMMGKPEIGEQVRENARRLAVEWKGKLETIEASLFIKYLQAYGLVGDVNEDEIFKIFKGVLHRNDAPELLRSLGLGHKAADFIEKLIAQKKRIEAVCFIYAFELVNQFSPVSLIKEHLDSTKKDAAVVRRSGKTDEARVEAANLEFTALSAAMTCIKRHKLESQFPTDALTKRITQLKKHRSDSKKLVSTSQSRTQLQKHIGTTRQSPNTNKQMANKRHQAAFPRGASGGARLDLPYSVNPTQQAYVSQVAAARSAPHSATESSFDRISVPTAYLQSPQSYLPQGVDISRATGGNGTSTFRNSMLSPTNHHQPPQLSTRGIHSSLMAAADAPTTVIDLPPPIRDRFQSHTDLHPTQQSLSQYADASHRPLMDSFAASRHRPFTGSIHETEGTNLTPGQYRSTGSSLVPPYEISPTASYGVGGSRHFARDDLAGIRSDLAAISEMKYRVAGSSSYEYAGSGPPVLSTFSRSQDYLQTHDYPARPSRYSYNSLSSQGQLPRYTP